MLDSETYKLLEDLRHAMTHCDDKVKACEIIARIDALLAAEAKADMGEPVLSPTHYSDEDRRADEALERAGERAYPECPEEGW